MTNNTNRVLKADAVKMEGSFHLDIGPSPQPVNASKTGGSEPTASVVQNTRDYAIIEVKCACGTKTRIRCEYGTRNENNS